LHRALHEEARDAIGYKVVWLFGSKHSGILEYLMHERLQELCHYARRICKASVDGSYQTGSKIFFFRDERGRAQSTGSVE